MKFNLIYIRTCFNFDIFIRITRVSRGSGSVEGQDEIFIFTERVIKEDIKVKFFQVI